MVCHMFIVHVHRLNVMMMILVCTCSWAKRSTCPFRRFRQGPMDFLLLLCTGLASSPAKQFAIITNCHCLSLKISLVQMRNKTVQVPRQKGPIQIIILKLILFWQIQLKMDFVWRSKARSTWMFIIWVATLGGPWMVEERNNQHQYTWCIYQH